MNSSYQRHRRISPRVSGGDEPVRSRCLAGIGGAISRTISLTARALRFETNVVPGGVERGKDGRLRHRSLKELRSWYKFWDMSSGFQPLSALDPDALIEYLGGEGHAAEAVRWKYFDSRFNRNRERGYAWVKDGKIGGFLGLIPFQVVAGDRVVDAAWTCDWSGQDPTARGIGILLIRQAQDKYEFLTQLGGNEATQRIISRLSSKTVNDAGIVFHLPLRLGAPLRVARRKFPRLPVDAFEFVNQVPLRIPRRSAGTASVIFEPGVSKVLETLLEPAKRGAIYSRYDFEYVQWQI